MHAPVLFLTLGPGDILEHNLKLILGMIWHLILRYQIAVAPAADTESAAVKKKKLNAKKLLVGWVNAALPNKNISNFNTDWNDGRNLSALVDYCKPGLIPDHATLDPSNRLENVRNAMNLAEENFGIPQVMQPEDLAVDKPDDLSVMTYVSYFCKPDSVGQTSLLAWIQQKIPHKNITNFTTDWVDGTAVGALTDVISGGDFPEYEEMDPTHGFENCKESMEAAQRLLDVEQTIPPDDFNDPDLDQLTRISYLTKFQFASSSKSPAKRLTASGPGITGDTAGKETNFLVRGRVPEWAKLEATVTTSSGQKLPMRHSTTSTKANSYYYSPPGAGSYKVDVTLDGDHIPNSPFSVVHGAPSNVQGCVASGAGLTQARVGETAEFTVDCSQGGPGDLTVEVNGPEGNIGTDVQEPTSKNFVVRFTPLAPGPHSVTLQWDGKPIPNSPFNCVAVDPKKCRASGPGLTGAIVGEPQNFSVKAEKAGPGELSVEAQGPSGNVPVEIQDDGSGNFLCTYVPKDDGDHTFDVRWSGGAIPGSPFKVNAIVPADASRCTVSNLPTGKLRAGKTQSIMVDASHAGTGEVQAVAEGPSLTEKCEVVKQNGLHAVNFTPKEVGAHKVNVTFNDAPIQDSPFEFVVNDPTKCHVNAEAIAKGSYWVKQPIDFRVSTQFAGEGELTASARGPKGATNLEVKDQEDGTYLVTFVPTDGGSHSIDIQFDGEQIPSVPIPLFAHAGRSADNVVVTQPVPTGRLGVFLVNHPYQYKVNTAGAGNAELTAHALGTKTGQRPELSVVDEGDGQYSVNLTAKVADDYQVKILWDEDPVPGSPFSIAVDDKPNAKNVVCSGPHYQVGSSEPVTLGVNAEKAGAGELTATCYGKKVGSVPVEVKEDEPKKYTVSFVPPADDDYAMSVLWSEESVPGSPFQANLIPPDASKCVVQDLQIPQEAGQPVKLRVDTSEAGNGELAADATGEKTGPVDVKIDEVEPNVFDVYFTPPNTDNYNFGVTWSGEPIPGAPFALDLGGPKAQEVFIAEPPTAMLEAGQAIGICFDTSKAGRATLTASAKGNKVGEIPCNASQRTKDKYDVKFTPPEPDIYHISVLYGGDHVKGSPFTVNLMPVDITKVKVIGPLQQKGLESPVELMLKTTGAGKGKVTAASVGSIAGEVPVEIEETAQDTYHVSFKPPQPDLYNFAVQYGGQDITGSPFRVNTIPPDAGKVRVTEPEKKEVSKPLVYQCDCLQAGSGKLTATCRGEKYGAVQLDITEKEDYGQYDVSFTPLRPDVYKLSIQWADEEVPNSPFRINLLPPDASKVKMGALHIPDEAGTGWPVTVDADCFNAGVGVLTAECSGELVGEVPVQVEKLGADKYQVKFQPKAADIYHFAVYYNGEHVPGSPYTINLIPPQPDQVKHTGTTIPKEPGKPATLSFNTKEAGRGSLSATVKGNSVGDVPVDVNETTPDNFDVTFVPPISDSYSVDVFWADFPVKDSPFQVDMKPPEPIGEVAEMQLIENVEAINLPDNMAAPPAPTPRPEPEELTAFIGDPLNLSISAEDEEQRKGELTATATGRDIGPEEVEITKNDDGTFNVYFNPTRPDHYAVDVKLNGEHVPSSPFLVNYINPVDPSKCFVFGLQDIPLVPQVNEPIHFGVDTREGGDGKLAVTADGPSGEEPLTLDVIPRDDEPGIYDVTYVPTATGLHRVHVLWSDQTVPGSPLQFQVGDASAVQAYPYGKPVAMDINADCKAGDLEAFAIQESTGARLKVKINRLQKGKFKLSFQPKEPGMYLVHVLLRGKDIPGSPYRILYSKPANPAAVKVKDLPEKGYVDEPLKFSVDVADAGSGKLNVKASGPSNGKESDFTVTDNEDGTYSAEYIPNKKGDHQFDVTWAGKPIPGSPFHVNVSEREAVIKNPLEGSGTVNVIEVGEPIEIRVSNLAEGVDEDYLVAQCAGLKSGAADVSVEKEDDGSYLIRFVPAVADDYTLNVKISEDDIEGSPFFIKAVEKGSLGKDFVHPEGACHSDVKAGEPVNVIVRADESMSAPDIVVKTEGPAGDCSTKVNDEVKGSLGLGFTPPVPGAYLIHAQHNGEPIRGSPFKVTAAGKESDPSKVGIVDEDMHLFSKSIPFGKPARFRISTVDAGPGTLNITSRGPGKAEVKVFDNKDGTYSCEFTPTVAGKYHIDVLWNDQHIAGSPYTLNFKSKKSRVITGLNLENENFRIGVPHRFKLHCEEIGQGILEITCRPPSAAAVRLTPLTTQSSYQCEITPQETGNKEISVRYNGKHILGSPFNVVFELRGDANKCRMVESSVEHQQEVGDNVSFCISTEGAGKGKLTASVENSVTKERVPVSITPISDDRHNVEFVPGDGAEYLLSIKYDEQHILGSPFKLVFGPPTTDASQCIAEGDGIISCQVEKWAKFSVNTEGAGPGELKVTIEGEGESLTPTISTINENLYDVGYLPTKAGVYKISIQWAEEHIPGSPYQIRCYNPADATLLSVSDPVTETYIGKPIEFTVNAEGAGDDGELVVTLQSSHNHTFSAEVSKTNDGNYICRANPTETGKYMAHVRWNGEHILGSPFKVKVMTPPKPENVRAYGPGLENGYVGQEGNFTVETGEGGAGTLAVRVHGPKGAFKINMRRHPDNDRTILVRYDPNIIGLYTVDVTWSDVHIPGSPFAVNIAEQQQKEE